MISPEAWGVMKVSKHHYAIELAARGNKVYFLNPPNKTRTVSVEEIQPNLFIVELPHFPAVNRLPRLIRRFIQRRIAQDLLTHLKISGFDIVWSFNPFVFQYLKAFNSELNIFHAVDVHRTKLIYEIAAEADVIFATSDAILSFYDGIQKPKYQINHGLQTTFLAESTNCQELNLDKEKLNFCYVGNLQYRLIHFSTISKIIHENPNINFYFIGPDRPSNLNSGVSNKFDYSGLKALDNTVFLGPLESSYFSTFLRCFDGFIACYKADDIATLSNLHKTLEFLSTGKVIVSSYSDQYKDKRDLLEMVDEIEELPERFKKVVNDIGNYNSESKMKERISFAKENTYARQVERIESIIVDLKNEG